MAARERRRRSGREAGGDAHPWLRAVAAGLAASAVVGVVDRGLGRLVSEEARRQERRVRAGSPHDLAGPRAGEALLGRRLAPAEAQAAKALFGVAYAVAWGLVYATIRRRTPALARLGGLPFAVLFYGACDGVIAPALGLTPTPRHVPWPIDAKELANHAAWTATAEAVHRATAGAP